MHMIKEKLMEELYEVEKKLKNAGGGKISAGDLEYIHKLTDTIKNIDKIEMLEDGGYSEATDFMGEGRMYGMSYEDGSSYARGRRRARRDSMGRYSREGGYSEEGGSGGGSSYAGRGGGGGGGNRGGGYSREGAKEDMIEKAEDMLEMAESEKERQIIREFIKKLEHS